MSFFGDFWRVYVEAKLIKFKSIRFKIKKPPTFVEGLWHHPGSNRGHKDFQSFALPTELQRHRIVIHPLKSLCSGSKYRLGRLK